MPFYKDLNERTPTQKPDLFEVQAISQNLVNIISTQKGTRPFEPNYGVNLANKLFDLMDDVSALDIFNDVIDTIKLYEPRAMLDLSQSDVVSDPDNNTYDVSIFFKIKGFENETFSVTQAIGRP